MPQILTATVENLKLSSKIICDTNILISYFDSNSEFNPKIKSVLNGIVDEDSNTQFLYTLISYLEGIEFMRRKTLTAVFNSTLGIVPVSQRSRTLELYRKFSQYNSDNDIPYFLDHQIKKIREAIIKASPTGHERWSIRRTIKKRWMSWHNVEEIIRAHGTSHMDSAILSLTTVASDTDGFLSNDRDLLTSVRNGSLPSTIRVYTFLEDYSTEKK